MAQKKVKGEFEGNRAGENMKEEMGKECDLVKTQKHRMVGVGEARNDLTTP